jgi:hypothetical protein
MRWFMRDGEGEDYTFYTLGTEVSSHRPQTYSEVYFHGKRPYVMGYAILETHKTLKSSLPTLIRPLQQESNAVRNDRPITSSSFFISAGSSLEVVRLTFKALSAGFLVESP